MIASLLNTILHKYWNCFSTLRYVIHESIIPQEGAIIRRMIIPRFTIVFRDPSHSATCVNLFASVHCTLRTKTNDCHYRCRIALLSLSEEKKRGGGDWWAKSWSLISGLLNNHSISWIYPFTIHPLFHMMEWCGYSNRYYFSIME